jgi:hypothetical protein
MRGESKRKEKEQRQNERNKTHIYIYIYTRATPDKKIQKFPRSCFCDYAAGEVVQLATGVSWHKGRNSQLQRRRVTPGNIYSSIASPARGQQALLVCEL